ncbi:MAG: S41 family peptidase [Rikenellaceae bacterium]|nr:S41 family peptidase [Rikenellaceae bacterium]
MRHFTLLLAALFAAIAAHAEPLWMRYPAISPDGEKIAFTYQGSIYVVPTAGGQATRLTTTECHNTLPVWSPDSKTLAYASDRYGNFDIFTVPVTGGEPTRLTTHSSKEEPYAFSNDGKKIYYGAAISDPAASALFPKASMGELYAVSVEGGRPERVLATPAQLIDFSRDGKRFLYQDRKGGEDDFRKHHTSSITRDIWLYDTSSHKHTQLTDWAGEDRNPIFSLDEKSIYFLSERGGTYNVWSMDADGKNAKQVTKFNTHPVRFLSMASNGTLCFGYNGEIYTMAAGSQAKKLAVNITLDSPTNKSQLLNVSGGSGSTLSPDGKQIAFVSRGEVFVTAVDYATTKQITKTAESESSPSFGADNRTLAYASERDGYWNIYLASISREDDPNFPNATLIDEKPLFKGDRIDRTAPKFSPDGKELAFVENRDRLMVMDMASGKVRQITTGEQHYSTTGSMDYHWSPDGKWFALAYTGNQHDPYSDIGIVSAEGGKIHNLTNTGYFDESPEWVLDGNALLFSTDRYGMRSHASWGSEYDVMIIYLNREAYEVAQMSKEEYEIYKEAKKKAEDAEKKAEAEKKEGKDDEKKADKAEKPAAKPIVIELENIEDRIVRLTPNSGALSSYTLNKEGDKLYYIISYEGRNDMWEMDLRSRENKATQRGVGGGSLAWDKKMENMFLLGGQMKKFKGGAGNPTPITVRADMMLDSKAERDYMFDRVYRQEKARFYHKDMHGVDWDAMRDNYQRFLPHIDNNYDFAEMLSEWLGELNVSHTGGRYTHPTTTSDDQTADLGLLINLNSDVDGLLVEEVVAGGPFDKASSKVKAGDVIESIDGVKIGSNTDFYPALNRRQGKRTLVTVYRPSTKERWEEVILPITQSRLTQLLYKRWVKQRAADVERLSGGRLGYVHIESMADGSFRTMYADILGKYNHCEGIVIDTRFNGGGRMHEDIEILFSGEKYLTQVVRGKEACDMPSRRWNKASIMITGEANYSNAHGTPWVYKYKGIGKIVGMPVPGTMTSVSWERLQDPSLVFGIPVVGYRKADGTYLENDQLEPDVKVANSPEVVITGRDEQLEAAVKTLLEQIDAEKK